MPKQLTVAHAYDIIILMAKRKILFEAGPMLHNRKTGVGYYIECLVSALSDSYCEKLEMTGFYFNFLKRHHRVLPSIKSIDFKEVWLLPGKLIALSRKLGFQPYLEIFVRNKAEYVMFANYVALPQIQKKKIILVVYDLSFLDCPEYTQEKNLVFLQRFCPPSIEAANTIITISEFSRKRLLHHFPDIQAKVVVTPIPPAAKIKQKTELTPRLQDLGIIQKSYILFLGTIEPRKNIEALVRAYAAMDPDISRKTSLVLAGGKGWKDKAILEIIAKFKSTGVNIIQTGYVSEKERQSLYSNASCFVIPSHYEGFGMPLLEAMQFDIPTAASDIAIFREVAGDATLYFNKDDPSDIALKLSKILTDQTLAKNLVSNGSSRLTQYSWAKNAENVYQSLV